MKCNDLKNGCVTLSLSHLSLLFYWRCFFSGSCQRPLPQADMTLMALCFFPLMDQSFSEPLAGPSKFAAVTGHP